MAFSRSRAALAAALLVALPGAALRCPVPARAQAAAPVAEACGSGVVQFHADAVARRDRAVSLALERPLLPVGPAPAGFPVSPEFRRIDGRAAWFVTVDPGTDLYGTGEVAGPLRRNGRAVTAWNFDAYGYDARTPHLYQSHPWVLAVRADGSAYGLLADTTWRCRIDLTAGILFVAEGPPYPLIAIERASPREVVAALSELTGRAPLPPLWALGYHQCRYSYFPDDRVLEVVRGFRERRIPCDTIWLDIDHMDGNRSFTFSPAFFPDPEALAAQLRELGFHLVTIVDPGIRREPGHPVYDGGTRADAWVKDATGEPYVGRVWPGPCVFPDFTNGGARDWWAGLFGPWLARGIDGIWIDMNEPAVFDVDGKTMPLDNVHAADPELGGPGPHARWHNAYGMLMARATREGLLRARPGNRPFVLTRANFLGGQRWAACWTGDNLATWEHLGWSIPMVLNLGLSGQPFAGPDIGGFGGDGDGDMFARWMGIGALLPFARGHAGKGSIDKEPWAFGPRVERTCRLALQRRYRLLPYLYTLFREAATTGLPVARPLFFADPADPALRAVDAAFLLGDDLLVSARTTPTGPPPALPSGGWRPCDFGLGDAGDADLPALFVREGGIVPLGPVVERVAGRPDTPLELLVAPDAGGRAEGELYEDAGEGFAYRDGHCRLVRFAAETRDGRLTVSATVVDGRWTLSDRPLTVRLLLGRTEVRGEGTLLAPPVLTLPR